jgi:HlyD family secretion protein
MQLASRNDTPRKGPVGIRDTAATDVRLEPTGQRRRLAWMGGGAAALLLLAVVAYPLFTRWLHAEVSVPLDRVRTATVTRGDFVRDVGVPGTIVAAVSPTLFAPADGTVTLAIQAGDSVTEGQVLATIDSPELENQLAQQQSALQSMQTDFERKRIEFKRRQLENQQTIDLAEVRITAAERELRRAEAAHATQVISQQDYEKANDDVATARLDFAHAKQSADLERESMDFELQTGKLEVERQRLLVANLERQVGSLEVASPVTGMVGNLLVAQKAAVGRNAPLITVVDLRAFEVEILVPETYGDDLDLGMPAEIGYGGNTFEGVVTAISPEVSNNQVTGRVRFAGEAPPGLRQNQRVSVRIVLEASNDVLMVERGPFFDSGGGRIAYVVNDDMAERRSIRVGASSVNALQIVEGLEEGDTIVVSSLLPFDGAETVYLTD